MASKRKLSDDNEQLCTKKMKRHLKLTRQEKVEKFFTTFNSYKFDLNNLQIRNLSDAMSSTREIFETVIEEIKTPLEPSDLVLVKFQSNSTIKVPLTKSSKLTTDYVLNELQESMHYGTQFSLDKSLTIESVNVQLPKGGGSKSKPEVNVEAYLHESKSIIKIRNEDDLCCARAIVTARARIENHPKLNSIQRGRLIQKNLAVELHQLAGVEENKCGIEEIKKFQAVMPRYKICVVSKDCFNDFLYISPNAGIPIYLYLCDGHFHVITKITGFLRRSYFCEECMKGYDHKEKHNCNNPCKSCHRIHDENTNNADGDKWNMCPDCRRYFKGSVCFRLHKNKGKRLKSTCDILFKCEHCESLVNTKYHKRKHVCGEVYCRACKDFFDQDHKCYMEVAEITNNDRRRTYIFFEFQYGQDEQWQCKNGYSPGENNVCINCNDISCGSHGIKPNMCVAQKVCTNCMDTFSEDSFICLNCSTKEVTFEGPDTTKQFCQWLFSSKNYGATVLSHTFKGFDSYPIVNYLHENGIRPEILKTGCKFTTLIVKRCKMRFIDSQNYLSMSLEVMAKSLDEVPLYEGFFPHMYNRREHQGAVLQNLPDVKYYSPDCMTVERRKEFMAWYEVHRNDMFDIRREVFNFCKSNVDLVRRCCLKFRSMFMNMSKKDADIGIDPFEKTVTIASACNLVFRARYLKPNTRALIPTYGYLPEEKQSFLGLQWLHCCSYELNVNITHKNNGGEKKIGPYKVDGYYIDAGGKKHVFEFHGCFWHGCLNCYPRLTVNPVVGKTMEELFRKTLEKQKYLQERGYIYTSIWECTFIKEMQENSEKRKYVESLDIESPLEPREAFFGGRTEGFKLFETIDLQDIEEKTIQYFDFTSLYPYINKTGKVPLGHPQIIKRDFEDIDKYEGLIKCKVLPPDNIYMPVLPAKINNKLMFGLCRTCCETCQQTNCKHENEERTFIGTWVTDEMKVALANGYKIMKIYEVWHFDSISQYNHITNASGVFTDFINTYLKLKQESSGWPDDCKTHEQKIEYIREYEKKEGIVLEYGNIKKNPGLRSLAKLMLNSFWGKFGQRCNLTKSFYVTKPESFIDLVTTKEQTVEDLNWVNEETIHVDSIYSDNFIGNNSKSNVVIAAYTTAQARIKLFEVLKRLNRRAIYCDTDSVVFVSKLGEWQPPLGDFLGDFKNEVPDNAINSFVTAGPKSYAYELARPDKEGNKSICKLKGLTHNFKNSLHVNYDVLTRIVTEDRSQSIVLTDSNGVRRISSKGELIRKKQTRTFHFLFDKRVIVDKYNTVPFGYRADC